MGRIEASSLAKLKRVVAHIMSAARSCPASSGWTEESMIVLTDGKEVWLACAHRSHAETPLHPLCEGFGGRPT